MGRLKAACGLALALGVLFAPLIDGWSANYTLAVTGDDFRAGRIIDDQVFFNGPGMTIRDIQTFLNAKVPVCDTNGSQPSGHNGYATRADWARANNASGPFTCLRDYHQTIPAKPAETGLCDNLAGGTNLAASEIIYRVAASCSINAKVLLVLLQKEQSLVTDDWPWPIQYRSATGYGCPDTAACDASYYGFFNQVYSAARQYKRYAMGGFNYRAYATNYVKYSPVTSTCPNPPGSYIYIENQATAALYNYTPYQPNSAALRNLYGTGDGCSAYGNRNFWRLYNDWFGSTLILGNQPASQSNYAQAACAPPGLNGSQVARLYNPDSSDYLLTTNANEICDAIRIGYIWDGITMQSVASSDPNAAPVFRLSGYGKHIYTTSTATRDNYVSKGFTLEGTGFYVYTTAMANTSPVYCLVKGDQVYYTGSGGESTGLQQQGFTNVGTAFLTPTAGSNQTTASRYGDNHNRRFYSADAIEKQQAGRYGYQYEQGQDITVNTTAANTNSPVYRLRDPSGQYFFTTNRLERDLAVINYGYLSEGITFYTPGNADLGPAAVYRLTNPKTGLRLFTTSALERDQAVARYGYQYEFVAWYGY